MRVFWIIVVLLVAGAGAASWYSSAGRGKTAESTRPTMAEEPRRSGEPTRQRDGAGTTATKSLATAGSDASKSPSALEKPASNPQSRETTPTAEDHSTGNTPASGSAESPAARAGASAPVAPPTAPAPSAPASPVTPPKSPEARDVAPGDGSSAQAPPAPREVPAPATTPVPEAVKQAQDDVAKAVEQAVAEAAGSPAKDAAALAADEKTAPVDADAKKSSPTDAGKPAEAPAVAPAAPVAAPPAAPAAGGGSGSTAKPEAKAGEAPAPDLGPIPATFENLENGSIKVDGRFIVKGEGTQQKPYEVTWDQLVSVSEIYNPRDGKKRLPERVTMLDGKYVKISGYVAFPLYVDKPKELLSMLNQWDGCCIGVPPTPFDAVEVRMKAAIEGGDRYATQGEVSGKFGVKPYLAGDWLVGLYVMDDAVLSTKSTAGSSKN